MKVLAVRVRALVALAAVAHAACRGAPAPLPGGEGPGLVRADDAPPPGAPTWARPEWRVGDRFTLVRGERLRGTFEVVARDEEGYEIDVGDGRRLRRDLDLGNLGEREIADGEPTRVLSPVDVRYHWPLWVGKRWECGFVDRARGGQALPMRASYVVEGLDRVTVPAGAFDALRIVRTLRLDLDGDWLTRTQVLWYAPVEGLEVRQLLGDTMVELERVERADS